MILDESVERILGELSEKLRIIDFSICFRYAYAVVEGKYGRAMGVAYIPYEDAHGSSGLNEVPRLEKLREYVSSRNVLEKVAGVALLNAVSQYLLWYIHQDRYSINQDMDAFFILESEELQKLKVVLIGYIAPLEEMLRDKVRELAIIERSPFTRGNALPDIATPRVLPNADVVFITGSALINDTIDYVLALSRKAKIKVLVGPTAQILPDVVFKAGITHVASTRVIDIDNACKMLKLGGGTRSLVKCGEKYVISMLRNRQ